jgi:peptidyl-prolyl cis-trans isomerase D
MHPSAPRLFLPEKVPVLETIVQKFRGVVVAAMVVLLSSIFLLQFGGPQAEGCGGTTPTYAAKVNGNVITQGEYEAAFAMTGADQAPDTYLRQNKVRLMVLHGLLERSLLAEKAREIGYTISEDEVMARVAEEGIVYLSMSVDASPNLPSGPQKVSFKDKDGKFSKENLRRFIQNRLRRSIREFTEGQVEETLAERMRETIAASVSVADNEIWDAFAREREKAVVSYARFSPVYFGEQLNPSVADLTTWMQANQVDVDKEYERQRHRYTGLEKQVRARHILLKVDSQADEATKLATRARAVQVLARVRGGEDFIKVAKEVSEDSGSAKSGGDLGFNPRGRMVAPFDDAQFALAPGAISDLVESQFGFHIIRVEAIREGDVPQQEAKLELAEKLYRERSANDLAKNAASALLARLNGGEAFETIEAELTAATGEGGDTLAPSFQDSREFGRSDSPIAGPFDAAPLAKAAFEMKEGSSLPGEPMRLGDDWFVYRLKSRTTAKRADLTTEERQRLGDGLRAARRREAVTVYVHQLMDEARERNSILVRPDLMADATAAAPTATP